MNSTSIAEHLHGHLVENDLLVSWSLVFDHERTNPVPLRLAHRLVLHVVPQEVVESGDLVDQREVVHGHCRVFLEFTRLETIEDRRSLVIQVDYEVF